MSDPIEALVAQQLALLGEDMQREGLLSTPRRVARALRDLTAGYASNPADLIKSAIFESPTDDVILVRDVRFYSLCEHHLLPFFGRCDVAYLPAGQMVGLSKIPRVIDAFSHRLQVQERLTRQIADCLQTTLNPRGVAVVVRARHLCMEMRGVEKQDSETVTSCMVGEFRDNPRTRAELMALLGG
ncbi:MAG TPA: GTP cyclohydrolase I FolE [Candidatus Dormibacteraeota bacterium]|jgi:GTP cyclohydrolase I|nr:GTP cyclohydrolase I FolE [Candidatus Dormibacteraeota bacterium]